MFNKEYNSRPIKCSHPVPCFRQLLLQFTFGPRYSERNKRVANESGSKGTIVSLAYQRSSIVLADTEAMSRAGIRDQLRLEGFATAFVEKYEESR